MHIWLIGRTTCGRKMDDSDQTLPSSPSLKASSSGSSRCSHVDSARFFVLLLSIIEAFVGLVHAHEQDAWGLATSFDVVSTSSAVMKAEGLSLAFLLLLVHPDILNYKSSSEDKVFEIRPAEPMIMVIGLLVDAGRSETVKWFSDTRVMSLLVIQTASTFVICVAHAVDAFSSPSGLSGTTGAACFTAGSVLLVVLSISSYLCASHRSCKILSGLCGTWSSVSCGNYFGMLGNLVALLFSPVTFNVLEVCFVVEHGAVTAISVLLVALDLVITLPVLLVIVPSIVFQWFCTQERGVV